MGIEMAALFFGYFLLSKQKKVTHNERETERLLFYKQNLITSPSF